MTPNVEILHYRFTPTGVGTTIRQSLFDAGLAVHPHGRGDNSQYYGVFSGVLGSPPRAWGQQLSRCPGANRGRFTPTGVGTTLSVLG